MKPNDILEMTLGIITIPCLIFQLKAYSIVFVAFLLTPQHDTKQ
jgi:hypothetical protein